VGLFVDDSVTSLSRVGYTLESAALGLGSH
jgi:hypothetical protein